MVSHVKFNRESQILDFILKERSSAFVLLALIARRAKRTSDHPDKRLEIGEAFIGDYKTYGATEQTYRSDKAFLKSTNQITTRSTSKGTIARLIDTAIFDINCEEPGTEITNQSTGHQRTANDQLTTNKNDKNEKNTLLGEDTLLEISQKYDVTLGNVKLIYDQLLNYCESSGKTYKNYAAALRNWIARRLEEGKLKPQTKQTPQERGYLTPADFPD